MSRAKKTYRPSIVSKREHIPNQYVAIGSFHKRDPGLHRQLNRLCERHEVDAFRLGDAGPWFVLDQHVEETQQRRAVRRERCDESRAVCEKHAAVSTSQIEAAVIALCEINNGITLMQATLERLTAAVENIATQPKAEPVGTWRDMNGECH